MKIELTDPLTGERYFLSAEVYPRLAFTDCSAWCLKLKQLPGIEITWDTWESGNGLVIYATRAELKLFERWEQWGKANDV